MNSTESRSGASGHEPVRTGHPVPGDQYRGPAGGGLVLVDGFPRDDGAPVPVERMDSGVHTWIPREAFDSAYQLVIPRTAGFPGVAP